MKMRVPKRLCSALIGIVFLVSGLLKLEDPVGTMLIVTEYARFFHMGFIIPAAKVIGIILGSVESLTGILLVTGVFRKVAAIATWVLLGFFTLVTLVLWIANPEMDCGCFGEAIHLSHAQSFLKNLVLLGLSMPAFLPWDKRAGHTSVRKAVSASLAACAVLYAVIYSNTHIPIADFTDFDIGTELFASLDDGIEADNHYIPVLIMEKDGQRGTFPLSHLPDSSWSLVGRDTLYREGIPPGTEFPILSFRDADGNYLDSLAAAGKTVVFSVYAPEKANWERLHHQYTTVAEAGATPLLLVNSWPEDIDRYNIPIDMPVLYADYKTLITLNRSNGGGAYFCNGELLSKWHERDFPSNIAADLAADTIDLETRSVLRRRVKAQGFILYLAAILILL